MPITIEKNLDVCRRSSHKKRVFASATMAIMETHVRMSVLVVETTLVMAMESVIR